MGLKTVYSFFITFLISIWLTVEVTGESGPCAGYQLIMKQYKDCEGNKKWPYLHLINMTVDLHADCRVTPRGCFRVKKGMNADTAEVFYTGKFGNKNEKRDICAGLEDKKIQDLIEPYDQIKDTHCPIQEGVRCIPLGHNSIEPYKHYLGMAVGEHNVKVHIYNSATPKNFYCAKVDSVLKKTGMAFG